MTKKTNKEWIEKLNGIALSKDKDNGKYYISKVFHTNYKDFTISNYVINGSEVQVINANTIKIKLANNLELPAFTTLALDDGNYIVTISHYFQNQIQECDRLIGKQKAYILNNAKLAKMPKIYLSNNNFENSYETKKRDDVDLIKEWRTLDHLAFAQIETKNVNALHTFHYVPNSTTYWLREDELFYLHNSPIEFKILEYAQPFDSNDNLKVAQEKGVLKYGEEKYLQDLTETIYKQGNYCNKTNKFVQKGKPFYKLVTGDDGINYFQLMSDDWINNLNNHKQEILAQGKEET